MNTSSGPLQQGLTRLAMRLIAITLLVAGAACVFFSGTVRHDVLSGLAVVIGSMLIGFVPLRMFLRQGPDHIVAGWIAAMILRMFACLSGFVILLKKYQLSPATCVWTVCGGYLILLSVETIGMNRLIRNAFDRQTQEARKST